MKTVKRKAEVGERIHELRTGRTETVKAVYDKHVSVAGYSKAFDAVTLIPHKAYEVIIEDEPKGISKRLEKFRKEMRRKHGVGVGIEFLPAEGEPTIVIRDLLTFSEKALKELHKLDALLNKKVEDEPEVPKIKPIGDLYIEPNTGTLPPHSSHYHQNGLDPLEVMRRTFPPEQYEGFLRGSLLKYTMRYDRKGQQQEDLEKLNFYGRELEEWKNALKDVDGKVIEAEGAE